MDSIPFIRMLSIFFRAGLTINVDPALYLILTFCQLYNKLPTFHAIMRKARDIAYEPQGLWQEHWHETRDYAVESSPVYGCADAR